VADRLFGWSALTGRDIQHAYGQRSVRSLCERFRWSALMEDAPDAELCPRCLAVVEAALDAENEYLVAARAARASAGRLPW
jgi:hypothetical protein